MNLKDLKNKQKNSLLESLQKNEEKFDGTLGKYAGSDYTIELKKLQSLFPFHKQERS